MEDKPRKKIMFPDFLKNVKVCTVSRWGQAKGPIPLHAATCDGSAATFP